VSPKRNDQRMMESTIVFGPGTKIGIDTSPLPSANRLQHAMLHGYVI